MTKYKKAPDEEIVELVRQQDSAAMDYLIRKYTALVKSEARKMYLIGADEEDLIQEGMIGLFQSIRDFDSAMESSFSGFAKLCVRRQIYSAVTASNRKKHQPLNNYVSFDEPAFADGETVQTVEEVIFADETQTNPEKIMLDREQVDMIESLIVERLSRYEKRVLELYLEGRSYDDIGEQLGKSRKAVDNAIQRIRKKVALYV